MLENITRLSDEDLYSMFCKVCKKPKEEHCAGHRSGYCVEHPVELPENTYAVSGGINWNHVVCSSMEVAEQVIKEYKHRCRPITQGITSFGGLQVKGFSFSYHKFE